MYKMKGLVLQLLLVFCGVIAQAQVISTDTTTNEPMNTAQNILAGNGGKAITVSGYGEVHFNQEFGDVQRHNGKMDVHRVIMFLGYKFTDKTFFVTELEFEHVKELYVEQAFLQHNLNQNINFRTGLMLIPMGIVNEYHEPTTFNGVERPNMDNKIIPTTWREIGAGFSGKFPSASLRYQLYVVNGLLSYDGLGKIGGNSGYRSGRQKGANSIFTTPNITGKVDFYGVKGLKIGLSGYFGGTQSTAYDNLDMRENDAVIAADSTVINMSMVGVDFRYQNKAFRARGQFIYSNNDNSDQYNAYTGRDLGSSFVGYYIEASYDVLALINKDAKMELNIFGRYENYDTHNSVINMSRNLTYGRLDYTTGFGLKLANGAVLKADYQQFINIDPTTDAKHQINLGLGVWF
jgi:hypothetical protein